MNALNGHSHRLRETNSGKTIGELFSMRAEWIKLLLTKHLQLKLNLATSTLGLRGSSAFVLAS